MSAHEMSSPRFPRLLRRARVLTGDERGSASVETALVGGIVVMLLVGLAEFGHAYWQHEAASKALQLGARLAVVSDPVSSDLKTFSGLSGSVEAGDAMPAFSRTCSGRGGTCSGGTFDRAALDALVYGPGNTACPSANAGPPPMCTAFRRIRPENIEVEYAHTGLGYAGRPGGPVPTITVRLVGLSFDFVVLNRLLGLDPIRMDGMSATATGEDLSGRAG